MEARFGHDFGDVRIHTGGTAEEVTRDLGARAVTQGSDVAFAPGAYAPDSRAGRHLLAHELTHVAQQRGATPSRNDTISFPSDPAEAEARAAGAAVAQGTAPRVARRPGAAIHRQALDEPEAGGMSSVADANEALLVCELPEMPAEARQQIAFATTVLGRVQPLSPSQLATLKTVIPGAAVLDLIRERDARAARLQPVADELRTMQEAEAAIEEKWNAVQGIQYEHGAPPTRETVAHDMLADRYVALFDVLSQQAGISIPLTEALPRRMYQIEQQVGVLSGEVAQVQTGIDAALASLGVASERDLHTLIDETFPKVFIWRGKQIAYAELAINREVVQAEAVRYLGKSIENVGGSLIDQMMETVRLGEGADPKALAPLRAAARELVALDDDIRRRTEDEVQAEIRAEEEEDMDTGVLEWERRGRIYFSHRNTEWKARFQALALQQPILWQFQNGMASVAKASDEELAKGTAFRFMTVLRNIKATEENIEEEDLKVWHLRQIVDMTIVDLGLQGSPLLEVVNRYIEEEERDEALIDIALIALTVTAGIIAALSTGGLALVAGGVALAAGGMQAARSIERYTAESAAELVALDPELADISVKDPSLFAVVIDVAGVVLDAYQVVKVFKALRAPATDLLRTGDPADLQRLSKVAQDVLPSAEAAERVVAGVAARASVSRNTVEAARAVREAARRQVTLAAVELQIELTAREGFSELFRRMMAEGRVHFLDEDTILRVLGPEAASRIITEERLLRPSVMGFYHPRTRMLFLRPADVTEMSMWAVHEMTHALQHGFGMSLRGFMAEYQAFLAQQDFVLGLERAAGRAAVPQELRWIGDMPAEDITRHISDAYGHTVPGLPDAERALNSVLEMVRTFERSPGATLPGLAVPSGGIGPAAGAVREAAGAGPAATAAGAEVGAEAGAAGVGMGSRMPGIPGAGMPLTGREEPVARKFFAAVFGGLRRAGFSPDETGAIRPATGLYPTVRVQPGGDVFGSYDDVLKYLKDTGMTGARNVAEETFEAHHLLEDSVMAQFGIPRGEAMAVAVGVEEHHIFSAEVPRHLPRGLGHDIDEVFRAHARAYIENGHPEWVDELTEFLKQHRDAISNRYQQGQVPTAGEPDFEKRRSRALKFLEGL